MENKIELDTEQKIILALTKTIQSIKEENLKVHKRMILESGSVFNTYNQILQALNRQNQLLEQAIQEKKLIRVTNDTV